MCPNMCKQMKWIADIANEITVITYNIRNFTKYE